MKTTKNDWVKNILEDFGHSKTVKGEGTKADQRTHTFLGTMSLNGECVHKEPMLLAQVEYRAKGSKKFKPGPVSEKMSLRTHLEIEKRGQKIDLRKHLQ